MRARQRTGAAAILAAASLMATPAVWADERAEAMRRAAERHRGSVVRVEVTTHVNVARLPGLGQGARRTHEVSVSGVVVGADGLVVFPAGALDPAALAYSLLGRTAPALGGRARVVGADGRVRDAEWVGRDPELGLAFVRVSEAGRGGLQPVSWAQQERRLGDALLVVSLTPSALGHQPRVDAARIAFAGEAAAGLTPEPAQALGGLAVTLGGEPLGLLSHWPAPLEGAPSGDVLRPDLLAQARQVHLVLGATVAKRAADPPREAQAAAGGRRAPAWLGVRHSVLSPERARQLGLDVDVGIYLEELYEGPAKAAGLRAGDVLLRLDGDPLDLDPNESFDALIADYGAGARVRLTVLREGKTREVELTLGEGPTRPQDAEHRRLPALGLLLRALTFYDRKAAGLDEDAAGAVAVELEPDAAASRAGLRAGDIILGVDQQPASGLADVAERLDQPGAHSATVRRGDQELTLRVRR